MNPEKSKDIVLRERVYRASALSMFIYSSSSIALPICLVMIQKEMGFSLSQAGALGFVPSIIQFFILLVSTVATAHFGKIRLLRSGLLFLSIGLLTFTMSRSWPSAMFLVL